MAEWEAWRGPNALGYVRLYFRARNCQDPRYRKANRALCRYWIRQERRRREAQQSTAA